MRSGGSVVAAMKNSGSPVLKQKRPYKFFDYTSQQVQEYFSARMPLQKQDLEDCVELMREGLRSNKWYGSNEPFPGLEEFMADEKFLDIGRDPISSTKGALFYDAMSTFIQQSDCSVLSAKDQTDLNEMLTSNIPDHSKKLIKNLINLQLLNERASYDFIVNAIRSDVQMQSMTNHVESWHLACESRASELTTMLNLLWKKKNLPGTLNLDAEMFQKQYIDPLLSAVLEFNNAATDDAKVSAYIKSHACAEQLQAGMYAMAACVYPKMYYKYIKHKKEEEAILATWKQEWQQKPSFKI